MHDRRGHAHMYIRVTRPRTTPHIPSQSTPPSLAWLWINLHLCQGDTLCMSAPFRPSRRPAPTPTATAVYMRPDTTTYLADPLNRTVAISLTMSARYKPTRCTIVTQRKTCSVPSCHHTVLPPNLYGRLLPHHVMIGELQDSCVPCDSWQWWWPVCHSLGGRLNSHLSPSQQVVYCPGSHSFSCVILMGMVYVYVWVRFSQSARSIFMWSVHFRFDSF